MTYEPLQKIKRTFREIETLPGPELFDKELNVIIRGVNNPPAYMVQILLLNVLGLKNLGPGEKTRCQTPFKFKGLRFMVRDSKFGWAIDSDAAKERAGPLALELRAKIERGTAALDRILHPYLNRQVKKGQFFLKNEYGRLRSLYEFHKKKARTASTALRMSNEAYKVARHSGSNFIRAAVKQLNKEFRYQREISNYSFAMVVAFFSMQEHILDAFYAFLNDGEGLLEFMGEDGWRCGR
jgi:hypothetical protein